MFNMLEHGKLLAETFLGNYRGIVVDVDDPVKAGRVRVKVHPMMDGIEDETVLPWALPATPIGGGLEDTGSICVPEIGSIVWVFFENGEVMNPVYFASSISRRDEVALMPKLAQEIADETVVTQNTEKVAGVVKADGSVWNEAGAAYAAKYPEDCVIKVGGHVLEFDKTEGQERVKIYHAAGSWVEIDKDGNIAVHAKGDSSDVALGSKTVYVNNKIDIVAGGEVGIKGVNVLVKALSIVNENLGTNTDFLVKQAIIPLLNIFIGLYNLHVHAVPGVVLGGPGTATSTTVSVATPLVQNPTIVTGVLKGE